ncbi:unnamed protein product [Echinostoma caproni]|uniref:HSF_DOMAIN domain-containing protein n=1 Tax=Echinostoma caproni TaxID=27848 RepID=A0A183ABI9_9TREM|nr:unnamed protein product [Echinostoma caproni]
MAFRSTDVTHPHNQSVFDVADRQIVVLLRQLRERQRSEKKTITPSAPQNNTPVEQLPKPTEAVKRGHPFESESSEDSSEENSEESSSSSDEASITANKKPALDTPLVSVSAAAGDHSANGGTAVNGALSTLMSAHRPNVLAEKMAGVEEAASALVSTVAKPGAENVVEPSAADSTKSPPSPVESFSSLSTSRSEDSVSLESIESDYGEKTAVSGGFPAFDIRSDTHLRNHAEEHGDFP